MPEIPLDSANRQTRAGQFETLKLALRESARIVMFEMPTFGWVHQLRAPKIIDGKGVQVNKQRRGKAGEDGDTYSTWDMDFIGRPNCLGSYETIADKGVDPDKCPACRRSTENDQVRPPERRFAINVIRYDLDGNGKLITPFSCRCLVWAFNESTFDKLISLHEEFQASGGLKGRDLRLGPCTSREFQNFEISVGDQSVWNANDETKRRVAETYAANKKTTAELETACGRAVGARWLEDDLARIAERWAIVDGRTIQHDITPAETVTVAAGIDELLNGVPSPTADPKTPETPAVPPQLDMSDLLGTPSTAVPEPASITPTNGGATVGFDILDDLLNSTK